MGGGGGGGKKPLAAQNGALGARPGRQLGRGSTSVGRTEGTAWRMLRGAFLEEVFRLTSSLRGRGDAFKEPLPPLPPSPPPVGAPFSAALSPCGARKAQIRLLPPGRGGACRPPHPPARRLGCGGGGSPECLPPAPAFRAVPNPPAPFPRSPSKPIRIIPLGPGPRCPRIPRAPPGSGPRVCPPFRGESYLMERDATQRKVGLGEEGGGGLEAGGEGPPGWEEEEEEGGQPPTPSSVREGGQGP